ncbi:MAG: Uma2 family endonuclease [Gemmataceae bacterium]|nr:Uma2 family endonuclease [Gemmataceae bacterium]
MSSAEIVKKPRPRVTVEQYLALERAASERSEYFDGEIIAMAGEKLPHGIISANAVMSLGTQLKGTPCFVVTKDTKVRSGLGVTSARTTKEMFSYPGILVVCGEPEFFDEEHDIIMNPTVIVEVLSPSTENFDRGEKFQRYRSWNPSLQDYVLIAQTRPFIEHFHRQSDETWNMHEASDLNTAVVLPSVGCTLRLADVYDRIAFIKESSEPT